MTRVLGEKGWERVWVEQHVQKLQDRILHSSEGEVNGQCDCKVGSKHGRSKSEAQSQEGMSSTHVACSK